MLTIETIKKVSEGELPLPLYHREQIARASHETLGSMSVYMGLDEGDANQIKKYSLDLEDKALQEGTTDYQRFGIADYAERYQAKPRTSFILVSDKTAEIAAYIWFGPQKLPELTIADGMEDVVAHEAQWYTSSYRTYGSYRGARIMTTFSKYIIDLYRDIYPDNPMWLAVQKDNQPAIKLYEKIGFEVAAEDTKEEEFIMILK